MARANIERGLARLIGDALITERARSPQDDAERHVVADSGRDELQRRALRIDGRAVALQPQTHESAAECRETCVNERGLDRNVLAGVRMSRGFPNRGLRNVGWRRLRWQI